MSGQRGKFEFDYWCELAARDPAAFERERLRVLNAFIEAGPESRRRRLRGLQWKIDCVCVKAGGPLAACVRISKLLSETVFGKSGLLARIEQLTGTKPISSSPPQSATVLRFARPAAKPLALGKDGNA